MRQSKQYCVKKSMRNWNEDYPSIDMELFGRKLKKTCENKHVTAAELQQFLHLGSIQAVYMWFEGKRLPNLDNLYAISKYLDIRMEELLEEGPDRREALLLRKDLSDHAKRLLFYLMHLG